MVLSESCGSGLYYNGVVQNVLNDFICRETFEIKREEGSVSSIACILQ